MKKYQVKNVKLGQVPMPAYDNSGQPVFLTDETMLERKKKVLIEMTGKNLDALIIYGDLEHGSNFEYLTGFLTRFEESLLVVHKNGNAYLLLGNENTKMVNHSRIAAEIIHIPHFSLPNQPMKPMISMIDLLKRAELHRDMNIGLVGWKYFTSEIECNEKLFDLPFYIVEAVKNIVGDSISNATGLFISAANGTRVQNNANEIAHYEFGSSLASDCVLKAMNELAVGKSELELAEHLNQYGQPHNVVSICATGERFYKANLYPTTKRIRLGDKISMTTGYKGGLASRAGYAAACREQLPMEQQDYEEVISKPYFTAITAWLENITIGMTGDQLYQLVERVLPSEQFGWTLNPGHLTADEEWMSSPVYQGSKEVLKSGMMLQIDIIPSVSGYGGVSAENGIVLADAVLRKNIATQYPDLWRRIEQRKKYLKEEIGVFLGEEVLPLSSTVAYYRPYFLNHKLAFCYKEE